MRTEMNQGREIGSAVLEREAKWTFSVVNSVRV